MTKLSRKQIKEGLDQIPIDVILSSKPTETKLTGKEKEFVKGIVEGKPKAQAYREAYNTKTKPKYQANDAYKISRKPHIVNAISREEVKKRFVELRNATQWREHILEGLLKESLDDNSPPTARIQALALLGKVSEIGLFEEKKTTTVIHKKSSDIEKELIEQLSKVIDVSPKETIEDDLLLELQGIPQEKQGMEAIDPPHPRIDPSVGHGVVHTILHTESLKNNNLHIESPKNNNESPKNNQFTEKKVNEINDPNV